MKKYILTLILPLTLFSKEISIEWLESKPKSVYKDFYIWRFLGQDISSKEALKAMEQARYFNYKIFHRFAEKYDNKAYKTYSKCIRMGTNKLVKKEAYCIEAGLSLYDATKLSQNDLLEVMGKTRGDYPDFAKRLEVLYSPAPFKTLINSDNETFFGVFNECGSVYRKKYFNETFPVKLLKRLKKDEKQFDKTIKRIVTNLNMTTAQKSLFSLNQRGFPLKPFSTLQ